MSGDDDTNGHRIGFAFTGLNENGNGNGNENGIGAGNLHPTPIEPGVAGRSIELQSNIFGIVVNQEQRIFRFSFYFSF